MTGEWVWSSEDEDDGSSDDEVPYTETVFMVIHPVSTVNDKTHVIILM
jgi:hypothetical protein